MHVEAIFVSEAAPDGLDGLAGLHRVAAGFGDVDSLQTHTRGRGGTPKSPSPTV